MGLSFRGRTKGKDGWVNYSASSKGLSGSVSTKLDKNVTLNFKPSRGLRLTVNFGNGVRWISSTKKNKEPKSPAITKTAIREEERRNRINELIQEQENDKLISELNAKHTEIEDSKASISSISEEIRQLRLNGAENYDIIAKEILCDKQELACLDAMDYIYGYLLNKDILSRGGEGSTYASMMSEFDEAIDRYDESIDSRLENGWSHSDLYYTKKLKERSEKYRDLLINEVVNTIKVEKEAKDFKTYNSKFPTMSFVSCIAVIIVVTLFFI